MRAGRRGKLLRGIALPAHARQSHAHLSEALLVLEVVRAIALVDLCLTSPGAVAMAIQIRRMRLIWIGWLVAETAVRGCCQQECAPFRARRQRMMRLRRR